MIYVIVPLQLTIELNGRFPGRWLTGQLDYEVTFHGIRDVTHLRRNPYGLPNLDRLYLYMQYYSPLKNLTHNKRMNQDNAIIDQIACECLLGRTRVLNRVLTSVYDDALRPFGLKATQLNLLVVVAKLGPVRRIDIGKLLYLDPSTLTRNLKIMLANGWIAEIATGEDGRGLPLQVTGEGRDLLNQISPAWRKAQDRTQKLIGDDGAALLMKLAANIGGMHPE